MVSNRAMMIYHWQPVFAHFEIPLHWQESARTDLQSPSNVEYTYLEVPRELETLITRASGLDIRIVLDLSCGPHHSL